MNEFSNKKSKKLVKLRLNPPLWIEDWGEKITFEYKRKPEHIAKTAYCIREIKVPLSEILLKAKKYDSLPNKNKKTSR